MAVTVLAAVASLAGASVGAFCTELSSVCTSLTAVSLTVTSLEGVSLTVISLEGVSPTVTSLAGVSLTVTSLAGVSLTAVSLTATTSGYTICAVSEKFRRRRWAINSSWCWFTVTCTGVTPTRTDSAVLSSTQQCTRRLFSTYCFVSASLAGDASPAMWYAVTAFMPSM